MLPYSCRLRLPHPWIQDLEVGDTVLLATALLARFAHPDTVELIHDLLDHPRVTGHHAALEGVKYELNKHSVYKIDQSEIFERKQALPVECW